MADCHFRHTLFQPPDPRPLHPGCSGGGRLYRWYPAGPEWAAACPKWHLLDDIRCTACNYRAPGNVASQMLAPPEVPVEDLMVRALRETLG